MPPLGIVASEHAAISVTMTKIETVMLTKILRLRGCGSVAAENRRAVPMARKMYEERARSSRRLFWEIIPLEPSTPDRTSESFCPFLKF